jgi:hypothetical protein
MGRNRTYTEEDGPEPATSPVSKMIDLVLVLILLLGLAYVLVNYMGFSSYVNWPDWGEGNGGDKIITYDSVIPIVILVLLALTFALGLFVIIRYERDIEKKEQEARQYRINLDSVTDELQAAREDSIRAERDAATRDVNQDQDWTKGIIDFFKRVGSRIVHFR